MPDTNFSIPSLLPIDSLRQAGVPGAPLMRGHFLVPGLQHKPHPVSDAEGLDVLRDFDENYGPDFTEDGLL